jgi:hypothetical protein
MRKMTVPFPLAVTAVLLTAVMMFLASNAGSVHAQARSVGSYAEDRAAIEAVIARMPSPAATTTRNARGSSTVSGTMRTSW